MAKLSGGFAEMDTDACVVYSFGGAKLNSVQSGYARPALAAGKSRFVLYNRSGNELRVESRTQNLYTKTLDSSIYCVPWRMPGSGRSHRRHRQRGKADRVLVRHGTGTELEPDQRRGHPLRMAFSPDSRRIAVAAVTANGVS